MKRVVVLVGAATLALAACAAPVPQTSPAPSIEAKAALLEAQANDIIADTFATIAQADRASDAAALAPRVGADAATVRQAEYLIAKATGTGPSELPKTMQRIYVSNEDEWPRVLAAVSEPAGPTSTPVVYLWVQQDVNASYELKAWAHMIPGASLPSMPGSVDGAAQLSVESADVTAVPKQTIESYVEYLRQGAESPLAANFAPDSYASGLFGARSTLSQAAAQASGAYVDTIQPSIDSTYVLSAADGGALVFAPIKVTSSFAVSGATLKVSDLDAPLLTGPATTRVTYEYRDFVVMYLPPNGSDQLPAVVAADHHLVQLRPE